MEGERTGVCGRSKKMGTDRSVRPAIGECRVCGKNGGRLGTEWSVPIFRGFEQSLRRRDADTD
jgi:hypothetical protein